MARDPESFLIATRGSALAIAQANLVLAECRAGFPGLSFALKIIKTTGDKLSTAALASAELPKGLFTKELEAALLNHEADLAVHSLKDLPTDLPAGLKLGAVGKRADVRDVLVYRDGPVTASTLRGFPRQTTMATLPQGVTVATSSTRRSAQLLEQRPDVKVVAVRGNVGTRLKKLAEQSGFDATILAAAGLERLQMRIDPQGRLCGGGVPDGLLATAIEVEEMLPCAGQAALGIEIRENDPRAERVCARLDHLESRQCVTAERAFLAAMGGGCHLAVAAYGQISDGEMALQAVSFLGKKAQRGTARGQVTKAVELGRGLAAMLQGR